VWLVALCRAGFERECAEEIAERARTARLVLEPQFAVGDAFVIAATDAAEAELARVFAWRELIFARQSLIAFARLAELPRHDRVAPIVQALTARDERFREVWLEAPDSEAGRRLAPLCRGLGAALDVALRDAQRLDPAAPRRLHGFFPQSDKVYLAAADPAATAPWPQGVPRLKFPRGAPSRSTLKLEEALLVLLDATERARWLTPGMTAVDLGAAPGGWTWQFVRRSIRVIAVDNGAIARTLLDSGLVIHRREDGFRFRPAQPVDWLLCDMVEQPRRVAELVARWLATGDCRRALFNLKLPMKQRYAETRRCLDRVRAVAAELRAKQLYHDREEITVFARRT
jgi:23S rRNA (cytidine2498-2'-O)-methyltransferase